MRTVQTSLGPIVIRRVSQTQLTEALEAKLGSLQERTMRWILDDAGADEVIARTEALFRDPAQYEPEALLRFALPDAAAARLMDRLTIDDAETLAAAIVYFAREGRDAALGLGLRRE